MSAAIKSSTQKTSAQLNQKVLLDSPGDGSTLPTTSRFR